MTAPYTDPRWDADNGGLPEHGPLMGVFNCGCAACVRERASHITPPAGRIVFGLLAHGDAPSHPGFRSDTCRDGAPGIAAADIASPSTITPPPSAEPVPPPHPADARIADAENSLAAAVRNVLAAAEWVQRAQAELRKARAGK